MGDALRTSRGGLLRICWVVIVQNAHAAGPHGEGNEEDSKSNSQLKLQKTTQVAIDKSGTSMAKHS